MTQVFTPSLKVLNFGGLKKGYHTTSAALRAAGWVGGQPLAIDANGLKAITVNGATGSHNTFCIAMTSSNAPNELGGSMKIEGVQYSGDYQLATLSGKWELVLAAETIGGVVTRSFMHTPAGGTWAVGDKIWLSATGKWDNAILGTALPLGVCTAVVGNPATPDSITLELDTVTAG